jgi:outer membrane protein TolC
MDATEPKGKRIMKRTGSGIVTVALIVAATVAIYAAVGQQNKPSPTSAGAATTGVQKTSGDTAAGLPKQWIDAADARVRSQSADLSHWWQVFNDPLLDELIREAYSQNVTLQKAKAQSEQAHSQLEYDEALVTVFADVASTYMRIRQCQMQIQMAEKNVELQTDVLKLVRDRFEKGAINELDYDQAQSIVPQTESYIARLKTQLRKAENRLCVLLGKPPTDLQSRFGRAGVPASPSEIAVGTPTDILKQRPDVQGAAQESTLTRREFALKASEEVENGIASYLHAHEQAERLRASLVAAMKAMKIGIAMYDVGKLEFDALAKIERSLVESSDQLIEAQAQIALSVIQIYSGLGGGWQTRLGQAAPSSLPQPPAAKGPNEIPAIPRSVQEYVAPPPSASDDAPLPPSAPLPPGAVRPPPPPAPAATKPPRPRLQ